MFILRRTYATVMAEILRFLLTFRLVLETNIHAGRVAMNVTCKLNGNGCVEGILHCYKWGVLVLGRVSDGMLFAFAYFCFLLISFFFRMNF